MVEVLVVPGKMGEFGVMARHAPLLSRLKPGMVCVVIQEDQQEIFFVSGGFLEVQPDVVTVLTDTALRTKELDMAAASAAKASVEKAMKRQLSRADYSRLKAVLALAIKLIRDFEKARVKKSV